MMTVPAEHENESRFLPSAELRQLDCERGAIHIGERPCDQGRVELFSGAVGVQCRPCGGWVRKIMNIHAPRTKLARRHPTNMITRFDDEDAVRLGQHSEVGPTGVRPSRRIEPHCERERAPQARSTFDLDFAAHQLAKLLGDREPQSGAAVVATGRGIGLREFPEEPGLNILGNADARIHNVETERHASINVIDAPDLDVDRPRRREFEGVADEVEQDLAKTTRIAAHEPRHIGSHVTAQVDTFLPERRRQQRRDAFDHFGEVELDVLNLELTRFHLRDVGDVVEDCEQGCSAGANGLDVGLLLIGSTSPTSARGRMNFSQTAPLPLQSLNLPASDWPLWAWRQYCSGHGAGFTDACVLPLRALVRAAPACHYHKLVGEDAIYAPEVYGAQRTAIITSTLRALGIDVRDYSTWFDCCGFGFRHILVSRDFSRSFAVQRKIEVMKEEADPDVLITHDTGCVTTLDQSQFAAKAHDRNVGLPVMSDSQLAALAMGAHPYKVLQFHWHSTSNKEFLEKVGIDTEKAWSEFQAVVDELKCGKKTYLTWEDADA